ncbi:MAG: GxxExxY protein [Saprospiraceae bacterium]|nr:GxxExxY protein [Saprospiraceae bacterium]
MEVHRVLGNGFQEVIYQRCLGLEFDKEQLNYIREKEIPLFYKGVEVGSRRADFVVENDILVELKALTQLESVHLAQALNYLTAYKLEKGLLINFGSKSLQYKLLFKK